MCVACKVCWKFFFIQMFGVFSVTELHEVQYPGGNLEGFVVFLPPRLYGQWLNNISTTWLLFWTIWILLVRFRIRTCRREPVCCMYSCFCLWWSVTWCLTSDLAVDEQDRVRLCEEAAGGSLEEHPREAAGAGSSGARGRCWFKKVSVSVALTPLVWNFGGFSDN